MDLDLLGTLNKVDVAVPLAATVTANRTAVDLRDYTGGGLFILSALNNSGTTPTLDVKLQDSPDNSTFTDVPGGAFTQVTTGAGSTQILGLNMDTLQRYVRVVDTLTGTSPNTTRSVAFIGHKQIS